MVPREMQSGRRSELETGSFPVYLLLMEICFNLTPCDETGGYVARWDDPEGGGICTQGDSFAELDQMIRDAVEGYFADREKPVMDLI